MNKYLSLISIAVLVSGCQSFNVSTSSTSVDEAATITVPNNEPSTPSAEFTEDSIVSLLTAEIAGQRDRFDIALDNYSQQAQTTGDAGVAERAFRIAEYLGDDKNALSNALIWAKASPDNLEAQRAAAIQLAQAKRYDEAMLRMEKVLLAQGDTQFDFLALSAAQSDRKTRQALL